MTNILPQHLADLRKSGLTDATITAAALFSETSVAKVKALLDTKAFSSRCLPCLVFPFTDAEGRNGYCRIRPDHPRQSGGKPVKYESPRGQPNQVYLPPGVPGVLEDASRELLLTEGEKKALAATQAGFPTIGLVGVFGWKAGKKETLLPALERIAWKGRHVFIVFDSDIATKPEVQDAESRLAAHLKARGAIVKVVRLPQGEPGPDGKPVKVGLDDWLVACQANGLDLPEQVRKLLDGAEEPTPPDGGKLKQAATEIDSVPEAATFIKLSEKDGVPRLRFWRGTWLLWRHGAYREVPPSEVRGELTEFLDRRFCRLTSSATSNVLDGLRAVARLAHDTEPPAWIGGNGPAWNPLDVVVCRNGMIDLTALTSGKPDFLRPATPRFFTMASVEYDFALDAPRPEAWLRFLDDLWADDPGSISALQEWIGYLLTPDTRHQKILLVIGPRRSGKGTIGRVVRSLIGPANVCGPTLASLGTNFGLWPLVGKSLAIVSDARLGGRTDSQIVVERLLSISGEDSLTCDRKNLEPITVKLPTRLMIFSNELPRLGDSSGALAGRMILLRLKQSFYGRENPELTDRLLTELPGILKWAVAGWKRLRDRGRFVQPTAADEMLAELHDLASPVGEFVRERCVIDVASRVLTSELHNEYKEWAESKGRAHIEDERGFGRLLRAAVPTVERSTARVDGVLRYFYHGIGISTAF